MSWVNIMMSYRSMEIQSTDGNVPVATDDDPLNDVLFSLGSQWVSWLLQARILSWAKVRHSQSGSSGCRSTRPSNSTQFILYTTSTGYAFHKWLSVIWYAAHQPPWNTTGRHWHDFRAVMKETYTERRLDWPCASQGLINKTKNVTVRYDNWYIERGIWCCCTIYNPMKFWRC